MSTDSSTGFSFVSSSQWAIVSRWLFIDCIVSMSSCPSLYTVFWDLCPDGLGVLFRRMEQNTGWCLHFSLRPACTEILVMMSRSTMYKSSREFVVPEKYVGSFTICWRLSSSNWALNLMPDMVSRDPGHHSFVWRLKSPVITIRS